MKARKARIVAANLFGLGLFGYYLLGANGWMRENSIIAGSLFFLGTIMVGIGIVGRAWCFAYIAGNKNEILVKEGPYSMCRNPLYLFSFLGGIGIGLCTGTVIIAAIITLYFLVQYPFTIIKEERHLRSKFSDSYDAYCHLVPRLLPSGFDFSEPDRMNISPRVFRRGVFDLVFFVVAIGCFRLIEVLHVSGGLPTFYVIY